MESVPNALFVRLYQQTMGCSRGADSKIEGIHPRPVIAGQGQHWVGKSSGPADLRLGRVTSWGILRSAEHISPHWWAGTLD